MTLAMARVEKPAPLYDAILEEREVCALSGELAGPHCPGTVRERFAPGTAPRAHCAMHDLPGVDLGPRFYDWAAHEGIRTRTGAAAAGERAALAFPRDGDEFARGDLPDAYQTIPVRALAPQGGDALELQLDSGPRRRLEAPFSTRIPAERGSHRLRLFRAGRRDPDATASFVVAG